MSLVSIGKDAEGLDHIVPHVERDRHEPDYLCGCNPDCLGDELGDPPSWFHWSFDSVPATATGAK